MAKRISGYLVKINQSYTVDEAAELLGINERTVRGFIKQGLPVLNEQIPTLILGYELRRFLKTRTQNNKQTIAADEIYCLRCRKGQKPYGMMVDYIPIDETKGRITGLCECCDAPITRFVSKSSLPQISQIMDVSIAGSDEPKRTL